MKEKVAVLIDKLQKLKDEDATLNELSHYTKLLYAELMCAKSEEDKKSSTRKVSVIMPGYDLHPSQEKKVLVAAEESAPSTPPEKPSVDIWEEDSVAVAVESPKSSTPEIEKNNQRTLWDQPAPVVQKVEEPEPKPGKELNDLIAEHRPSLNDKLKKDREEIVSRLEKSPVKDLHHAIGLNEKFGYINELFRGDQSLYNRSIKTINDCKDLQEALYWIDRELKIKLAWQEKNKTVQNFYALIKKRFS